MSVFKAIKNQILPYIPVAGLVRIIESYRSIWDYESVPDHPIVNYYSPRAYFNSSVNGRPIQAFHMTSDSLQIQFLEDNVIRSYKRHWNQTEFEFKSIFVHVLESDYLRLQPKNDNPSKAHKAHVCPESLRTKGDRFSSRMPARSDCYVCGNDSISFITSEKRVYNGEANIIRCQCSICNCVIFFY